MNQRIIAYLRVSTDKQNLEGQKLAILDYANRQGWQVNHFSENVVAANKKTNLQRIQAVLDNLQSGDTLLVAELSRLGRSTIEVLTLVNNIVEKGVNLIIIKENLHLNKLNREDLANDVLLTVFAMLGKLERNLIAQRTKEGLALKKALGIKLGKPKGTLQKSIFDSHKTMIKQCLSKKITIPNIQKFIGIGTARGLYQYVKTRKM